MRLSEPTRSRAFPSASPRRTRSISLPPWGGVTTSIVSGSDGDITRPGDGCRSSINLLDRRGVGTMILNAALHAMARVESKKEILRDRRRPGSVAPARAPQAGRPEGEASDDERPRGDPSPRPHRRRPDDRHREAVEGEGRAAPDPVGTK